MIAIASDRNEIARFLLAHPDVKKTVGKNGKTLLHYAVKNKGFSDIIEEIRKNMQSILMRLMRLETPRCIMLKEIAICKNLDLT